MSPPLNSFQEQAFAKNRVTKELERLKLIKISREISQKISDTSRKMTDLALECSNLERAEEKFVSSQEKISKDIRAIHEQINVSGGKISIQMMAKTLNTLGADFQLNGINLRKYARDIQNIEGEIHLLIVEIGQLDSQLENVTKSISALA